ncbi:MAG: DUF5615 family PIN-like protein [Solirubrobacteraceae bacterium]
MAAPEPALRLLLDSCFPPVAAARLRALGHDAISVHDPEGDGLAGAADEEIWKCAVADDRAIVTENAADYGRLEALALARGEPGPALILTAAGTFPRGAAGTTERFVAALDALIGM